MSIYTYFSSGTKFYLIGQLAVSSEPALCNGHLPYPWGWHWIGGGGWGVGRRGWVVGEAKRLRENKVQTFRIGALDFST